MKVALLIAPLALLANLVIAISSSHTGDGNKIPQLDGLNDESGLEIRGRSHSGGARMGKGAHFSNREAVLDASDPSITVSKLQPLRGPMPAGMSELWNVWCRDALDQATRFMPQEQKQYVSSFGMSFGRAGLEQEGTCCAFYVDADGYWLQYATDLIVPNLGLQTVGTFKMSPNEGKATTGKV